LEDGGKAARIRNHEETIEARDVVTIGSAISACRVDRHGHGVKEEGSIGRSAQGKCRRTDADLLIVAAERELHGPKACAAVDGFEEPA
jgi:hypothetical protein